MDGGYGREREDLSRKRAHSQSSRLLVSVRDGNVSELTNADLNTGASWPLASYLSPHKVSMCCE